MKLTKLSLLVIGAIASTQAHSAAFQLAEHSASGLGRAFAGDAAIAEDASVIARNPALMSQFEQNVFTVAATYIKPDVSLEGLGAPAGIDASSLNDDSIAPAAVVPGAYFLMPVDDKLSVGLGAFSNFGLASELSENYPAGQIAGETSITTVNLNASAAYKLNEQWTVGAGLNIIYAEAELTRFFGETPLPLPVNTVATKLEGDDIAFGWNVGVSYDINDNHRLGFSYRSEVEVAFEGDYTNQLPSAFGGLEGSSIDGRLNVSLPAIAEISGVHQTTTDLSLHYSVMWIGWSSLDRLDAVSEQGNILFSKVEDFSDSYRYALGGTYQYNSDVTVRFGIAYDETPSSPAHMSISIPDNNRVWYSTGFNYKIDDNSSIDFGVTYIQGKGASFTEADNLGQQWQFYSEGNATLIGLQYNQAI
ncbi:outer membrane protein transport protein [Thalassotalea maritima]|uniref:outer membrane protein transport protein n=1 Tax=Thalassotalea maritima TaxID=3242416 RepID=UPI003527B86D